MKEFNIPSEESGQKLIRFLNRILPNANNSFLYKMLRKKNITVNEKRCNGNETLLNGDVVKIFFSDDTFSKFSGKSDSTDEDYLEALMKLDTKNLDIVYESKDIICLNKNPGLLSQKSSDTDVSANELLIAYLLQNNKISRETLASFRPSVINRLDRNTSGILIFGKTMNGIKIGNEAIKNKNTEKTYHCIVKGKYNGPSLMKGYLVKDKTSNYIKYLKNITNNKKLYTDDIDMYNSNDDNCKYMEQEVKTEYCTNEYSYLTVILHTGRSHQIRASLSYYGFPIIGDVKYGDRSLNNKLKVKRPLLHSYSCIIEGNTVVAPDPEDFNDFIR
jgi:23S rRNA pseudouridine955/2504/2580 synthase